MVYVEEAATAEEEYETLFPSAVGTSGGGGHARKAALGLLAMLAVGAVVAHTAPSAKTGAQLGLAQSAGLGAGKGVVELEGTGLMAMVARAASAASSAARLVSDGKQGYKDINDVYSQLSAPEQEAAKEIAKEGRHENLTQHFAHLRGEQLFPKNNMNDANQCPDDEEMHLGVCYTKCVDLTKGQYPIRTTAFSCCMQEPCSFFNSKFSSPLSLCKGLDVSGALPKQQCPHEPGDCLRNEEFSLGVCYKTCSLLTWDEFPYRSGPDICCKYHNHLACLDPLNTKASQDFNVGGGKDDEMLSNIAGTAHMPMPELAEVQTTTTLPTVPMIVALPVVQGAMPPVASGTPIASSAAAPASQPVALPPSAPAAQAAGQSLVTEAEFSQPIVQAVAASQEPAGQSFVTEVESSQPTVPAVAASQEAAGQSLDTEVESSQPTVPAVAASQ